MEHKHTPGPWSVAKYSKRRFGLGQSGDCALYLIQCEYGDTDVDICRADARLIAAAPDLLAGLEEAIDALADGLWDYGPGQDEHDKCNEVIGKLRTIVARATGTQQ